jgi:hypothetical protein
MAGLPPSLEKYLDYISGQSNINFLADKRVWNAVEMLVDLDVVIDMDFGFPPLGEFESLSGQCFQCRPLNLFEKLLPTAG